MVIKAIIPAAGSASKKKKSNTVVQSLVPILAKPALHYVLEEGIQGGIKNFVMITDNQIQHIAQSLAPTHGCSHEGITETKSLYDEISPAQSANITYVQQLHSLGTGHAVYKARYAIGKEMVAIMMPDDVIIGQHSAIGQIAKIAQQEKCNVIAVQEVAAHRLSNYGVIGIKKQFSPNLFHVREVMEKPAVEHALSHLAIVGRYIFSPTIFDVLQEERGGALEQLSLTDAIQKLIYAGEKVFAYKIQGSWYDVSTPIGLTRANVSLALKTPAYSEEMLEYLATLDKDLLVMEGKIAALKQREV